VGTATVNVQVIPSPTLSATAQSGTLAPASSISVCPNTPVTLSVSGASSYSWSNGQTSPSFTLAPSTSTIFNVVGTGSAGCTSSAQVQIVVLICNGLVELSPDGQKIYPNPFQHQLVLESGIVKGETIFKLTDLTGKVIYSLTLSTSEKQMIQLPELAKGLYIYRWEDKAGHVLKEGKLIRE
jgi:hypothetical protein